MVRRYVDLARPHIVEEKTVHYPQPSSHFRLALRGCSCGFEWSAALSNLRRAR